MRNAVIAVFGILIAATGAPYVEPAPAQTATIPVKPTDTTIPPEVIFPDAVVCDVTSPAGIVHKIIFYKSQTLSFAHEPNNVAEYGTTFIRDPDKFEANIVYKWRLQLGKPGNITALTVPSGWSTSNCPIGKPIASLMADKQALRIFTTQ